MYKPKEITRLISVIVPTLQHWNEEGVLKTHHTLTNQFYYTKKQYLKYTNEPIRNQHKVIGYLKILSLNQIDDEIC